MRLEAGAFSTAGGTHVAEYWRGFSLALDALMTRRCLTLLYYSTKQDSCEARRSFREPAPRP